MVFYEIFDLEEMNEINFFLSYFDDRNLHI